MPHNHFESGENKKRREEYALMVGTDPKKFSPLLAIAKYSKGSHYKEVGEREVLARKKLKNPSKNLRLELIDYNKMSQRALERKANLVIEEKDSCVVCERKYEGAYRICPVCIDIYINSLRSCDALRILDSIEKTGKEED